MPNFLLVQVQPEPTEGLADAARAEAVYGERAAVVSEGAGPARAAAPSA